MPQHPKRDLVRLSNEIANAGAGPLEIFPSPVWENCDGDNDPSNGRTAYQRVFQDSPDAGSVGYFNRGTDGVSSTRPAGCMHFHPQHNHWHFDSFSSYRIYREGNGKLLDSNEKVSYCVVDNVAPLKPPPQGQPSSPYYPTNEGCDQTATEDFRSAGPMSTPISCRGSSSTSRTASTESSA